MSYLKVSLGIFVILAISRFVPHPPNFTSLLALSFYVPALLGLKFLPILLLSFFITDIIIGLHNVTFFTWGSIIIINFFAIYFKENFFKRITGSLLGALVFFIFTNLGVYLTGNYGFGFNSLLSTYVIAIPFFGNTILSTIIFSLIFEVFYKSRFFNYLIYNTKRV